MGIFQKLKSLWSRKAPEPTRETAHDAAPERTPAPVIDFPAAAAASPAESGADAQAPADFLGGIVDDLEASIGDAFDSVTGPGDTGAGQVQNDYDDQAAQELFASIAANYTRPVKNFIHELRRGTASKEWIEICQPVMGSIISGAESLKLDAVAKRIDEFREALTLAGKGDDRVFDEESRALLLSCYDGLVEALPETFALAEEDGRRESILIHSLLRQIPEVGSVTLEKMYGAGVTSLNALLLANREDLSHATGVPDWLCQKIVDKVREHREQLEAGEGAELDRRDLLAVLVKEMQRQQEIFQRISRKDEQTEELAAEKRECLRARQACALKINVLLAEMDEVDLVEQLRKMSPERRILRLEEYLKSAPVAAAADLGEANEG